MDLQAEALRLQLDALAVELSRALALAGVPHALLKGPTTSLWLYDPPRPYQDVDLLVPLSSVDTVVKTLVDGGLATRAAGRIGEEAAHSLLLRSRDGFEIDLHVSLPLIPVDGDRIWTTLVEHVVELSLDVGTVPALDEPGRCVVLALHALGNGSGSGQPREDLERARQQCGDAIWTRALALADRLAAGDLVRAGLALVDGTAQPRGLSAVARLHASSASAEAIGIARIIETQGFGRLRLIGRELFPSEGFLRFADPGLAPTRRAVLGAHVRRLRRIARALPAGLRAYLATRHG